MAADVRRDSGLGVDSESGGVLPCFLDLAGVRTAPVVPSRRGDSPAPCVDRSSGFGQVRGWTQQAVVTQARDRCFVRFRPSGVVPLRARRVFGARRFMTTTFQRRERWTLPYWCSSPPVESGTCPEAGSVPPMSPGRRGDVLCACLITGCVSDSGLCLSDNGRSVNVASGRQTPLMLPLVSFVG